MMQFSSNTTLNATYGGTLTTTASTVELGISPTSITESSYSSSLTVNADIAASRIATYRGLADTISEISGLRAYTVDESDVTGTNNDVLQESESFSLSTKNIDMIKGMIQIESLIPGETFTISEVGESSGNNTVAGSYQNRNKCS